MYLCVYFLNFIVLINQLSVCVFVGIAHMSVCTHELICQRQRKMPSATTPHSIPLRQGLSDNQKLCFGGAGWTVNSWDPLLSDLRCWRCSDAQPCPTFDVDAVDFNSGSHAVPWLFLLTELTPHLLRITFLKIEQVTVKLVLVGMCQNPCVCPGLSL